MTSRDFCYWLQGFFEINARTKTMNEKQVKMVQNHLRLVFKHEIDPSEPGDAKENQHLHDHGSPFDGGGGSPMIRC